MKGEGAAQSGGCQDPYYHFQYFLDTFGGVFQGSRARLSHRLQAIPMFTEETAQGCAPSDGNEPKRQCQIIN